MKFFLDTANIDEIRNAAEYGLIDGVTTNPSLVSKEGRPFKDILLEITQIVDGPISAEVVSTDANVYAIDLSTHQSVWQYGQPGMLAISGGSTLYIATGATISDGRLVAIRLK